MTNIIISSFVTALCLFVVIEYIKMIRDDIKNKQKINKLDIIYSIVGLCMGIISVIVGRS